MHNVRIDITKRTFYLPFSTRIFFSEISSDYVHLIVPGWGVVHMSPLFPIFIVQSFFLQCVDHAGGRL
jgi:hypothetical protein